MSLLIRFCKRLSVSLVLRYFGPLPKSPLVSLLTYQFPDFYCQTNRIPFVGFRGNLFSDGTSNCVGQCVNVVDQGIITEILGQFLIFILSKCVSVILHTYVYAPYGGETPPCRGNLGAYPTPTAQTWPS